MQQHCSFFSVRQVTMSIVKSQRSDRLQPVVLAGLLAGGAFVFGLAVPDVHAATITAAVRSVEASNPSPMNPLLPLLGALGLIGWGLRRARREAPVPLNNKKP
jgi:hypothetical protein